MKKSFQSMTVILGEDFTNDDLLNSILNEGKNNCAILYPNENAISLEQNSPINALTHLILIDGTWRKAKRIFTLSKNLHSLPSFKLLPENNSDYRIRKAPNKESLSTLEATVYALQILEPNLNTKAAVTTFDKMIDFQIKKMGREVFQKNYLDKKQ
jgi:DTW domain-containing protein YfiP